MIGPQSVRAIVALREAAEDEGVRRTAVSALGVIDRIDGREEAA